MRRQSTSILKKTWHADRPGAAIAAFARNSMTATLGLEIARFVAMIVVVAAIVWFGKVRAAERVDGLNFILVGFALLIFGSLVDLADDYEWSGELGRLLSSDWAVILEKGVGYLGGFALLAVGFMTWFPKAQALAKEIEQRRRAEALLAQAQKMEAVGHLTGGVAHDFNNLLAVILGNLELLRESSENAENLKHIDAAIGASQRGGELTRNMLSFARKAYLKPQPVDLNELISRTNSWIARTIPENIDVQTSLLPDLWTIEADPTSTESALLNLVLNARDAMPKGGRLTIETANVHVDADFIADEEEDISPGEFVILAVSDNGAGIPDAEQQLIFDPFFTTKQVGSGLGLSMIQGFVKQSGGFVRVHSEVGQGTTFRLYFPAMSSGVDIGQDTRPATVDTEQSEVTVLVVEDEEQVMQVICETLRRSGYTVLEAGSGSDAISVLEEHGDIDILLTDIVMAGDVQGPELARKLRARRPDLPVVFMSGYATEEATNGNGLRPEDVRVMKPVTGRDLIAALQKAMAGTRREDESNP